MLYVWNRQEIVVFLGSLEDVKWISCCCLENLGCAVRFFNTFLPLQMSSLKSSPISPPLRVAATA